MIDLHCHILPGMDDGPETVEESLAMARMAIRQGISHILCTPHHNNGRYINPADKIIPVVQNLQRELDQRGLALSLYEGQEVRLSGQMVEAIQRQEILFTDLDNQYLLIEFPTMEVPAYAEQLFFQLIGQGHTPVIVHPERNAIFGNDPNRLLPFLDMGVLTQLTAPSIVGFFGKKIQKTAKIMLDHQLGFMVASDAHSVDQRGFYLMEAYQEITKEFGASYTNAMQQMAKDLLNGDPVQRPAYQKVKKRFFLR
ncbi:tyrosine-protein phosphatase [Enterococcus sp. AZ109]|uniref:tyrosine-protein phosphatase n=1 Tax=Enterococcus sp. AZ109 TaxID=2774634 RepID=UPI003F23C285